MGQELLEMVRKRGGDIGVEVGNMRNQVDKVMELLDIFR